MARVDGAHLQPPQSLETRPRGGYVIDEELKAGPSHHAVHQVTAEEIALGRQDPDGASRVPWEIDDLGIEAVPTRALLVLGVCIRLEGIEGAGLTVAVAQVGGVASMVVVSVGENDELETPGLTADSCKRGVELGSLLGPAGVDENEAVAGRDQRGRLPPCSIRG